MTSLKQVADVRVSNVDKKRHESEAVVRLCNYTDVYYGDVLTADSQTYMEATASLQQIRNFRLAHGDTVLTKDSETPEDIGVSAYIAGSAEDFVCGYHLAIVRPLSHLVNPKYLTWFLRSEAARGQLSAAATGVTRFGLRMEALATITLDLPPLEEQRRIADFLDEQVAVLNRAILLEDRARLLYAERLEAVREHLLLHSTRVKWTPLHRLVDESRPISYGIVQAGPDVADGIPYIKTGDMLNFRPELLSRTSPEIESAYRRSRVRPGDLVVAMRASIGSLIVVPETLPLANLTQGTARIAAGAGVDSDWLYQVLVTRCVQEQFQQRAVGSTFRTLNLWDLRRISVPVPLPIDVRRLVGSVLKEQERGDRMANSRRRKASLLQERKRSLITAAVTGQFDVTTARAGA